MKHLLAVTLIFSVVFAGVAYCQAMVGYGLGVGRSGVAGAAAGKSTGKATSAVLDKTTTALETAGKPGAATAQAAGAQTPAKPEAEKQVATLSPAIDPNAITPGLERSDLLARFGKPSMKITNTDGSDVVEKLWYRSPGREAVLVTLRNGKVAAVSPPATVQ